MPNKEYKIKVVVSGNNIKCFFNNILMIDYTHTNTPSVFQVTSTDETGDIIIKLVNVEGSEADVNIKINSFENYNTTADVIQMAGKNGDVKNSLDIDNNLVPEESTTEVSEDFTYTLPKYSVTILRIHKK